MKLTVNKDAILDGLQKVQSIVSTRSTLPVLYNVYLKAEKETLWLTTTDLEVTVRTCVPVRISRGRKVRALAFVADPHHPQFMRELDLHSRAQLVAQGVGHVAKEHRQFVPEGVGVDLEPDVETRVILAKMHIHPLTQRPSVLREESQLRFARQQLPEGPDGGGRLHDEPLGAVLRQDRWWRWRPASSSSPG